MINIGLDFGSTYTVISIYRNGEVKPVLLTQGASPFIPSVALRDETGELEYGMMAKQRTAEAETVLYKAFKMMMREINQETLRERGYDESYTPESITKGYLCEILTECLEVLEEDRIGTLVVGVPEIWYERDSKTVDCCEKLRKICQSLPCVEKVQIVSEPAAASAYFAWNYKKKTGQDFCGYIFLIDYGGGTLDITLNEVESKENKTRIIIKERTGAGENEEREIGKAGIVYMEKVVSSAIEQCLDIKPQIDSEFYQAVDRLEQALQSKSRKIREFYQDRAFLDLEELEEPFIKIRYMGTQIPITYGLMASVYRHTIRNVLKEQLDLMINAVEKYELNYKDVQDERFKIVLVGGFCNFYLTRKQAEDYFHFTSQDKKWQHMMEDQTDCENAISFGAALIANEVIHVPDSAPYSIGIYEEEDSGNFSYAIRYKEEITYGKPYFQMTPKDEMPKIFIGAEISKFVINKTDDDNKRRVIELKKEWKEKIIQNRFFKEMDIPTYAVGFSIDRSNVLSIHLRKYDDEREQLCDQAEVIELDRWEKCLG